MSFPGRKLTCLLAILAIFSFGDCSNPLDPIDTSSRIRGLSFIDFSMTWDRWDSDIEFDGVAVTVEYFNEFSDSLTFHDKTHRITIEFYTQKLVGQTENEDSGELEGGLPTVDELIFSHNVRHSNSDDEIRIPIEAYRESLESAGFDLTEDVQVFVVLTVFPPLADPLPQLQQVFADQVVFQPEPTAFTEEPETEEP